MKKFLKTNELFSNTFQAGLQRLYGQIPSTSFIAAQFSIQTKAPVITRETARKWLNGTSFPSPNNLVILIKWLQLDPKDFLVELAESTFSQPVNPLEHKGFQELSHFSEKNILDALTLQVAVVDSSGVIVQVNKAWRKFGSDNAAPKSEDFFLGYNYLTVCENAVGSEAPTARAIAAGIRQVLNAERPEFAIKYLCHSPTKKRWFVARVASLIQESDRYAVISHEAVSEKNYLNLEFD